MSRSIFKLALSLALFPVFLISGGGNLQAQALPVGSLEEEQIRMQELMEGNSGVGLVQRPVWRSAMNVTGLDSTDLSRLGVVEWLRAPLPRLESERTLSIGDMEVDVHTGLWNPEFQVTTNSRHPYGENNAAAWYGKGVSTEFFAGGYVTSDYLTVSVRPQLVWQQNNDFPVPRFIPRSPDGMSWFTTEGMGDRLDAPFRFGPDPFWTLDPGHSSIRLHYGAFEVGYGTDPLWWGPALRYPLVMSNNAPGFAHSFIGLRRPVQIPWIGSVQVRWTGGKPSHSDWFHEGLTDLTYPELDALDAGSSLDLSGHTSAQYGQGPERYLSTLHLSWSPAISPNLTLGLIRAVHSPLPDGTAGWDEIRSVLDSIYLQRLQETQGPDSERTPRYTLNSLYARWIWPESRFEIFGEYLRDDLAWDSRDLLMEPHHNSGYAFGFQKMFRAPLAPWYRAQMELTNLTPSYLVYVRPQRPLYTHPVIPQGHTNRGQLMGAAIGPGSNSQFLKVDALADWGRVGIFFQRKADNNAFHYDYDQSLGRASAWGDYKRHRTDLTVGLDGLWFAGPLAITVTASWTTMLNYGRFDYDHYGPEWGWEEITWNDLRNVHLQVGVQWLLR